MTPGSVWAVVPVKPFGLAKRRLAAVLDPLQRAELARVMFEDVLDAIVASRHLFAGVIVPTPDEEAAALARRQDAVVLPEAAPAGINAAIALAIAHLGREANAGMLVVPADVPHVSADALASMVDLIAAPRAVALVPASADRGTNLFACRPAGIIVPRFGPRSFERHVRASHHAGVTPSVVEHSDLGIDLDRPGDLASFLATFPAYGTRTRTHAFLSRPEISGCLQHSGYNSDSRRSRSSSDRHSLVRQ